LLQLELLAMSRLFGAVAADRHAAPPARVSAGVVGEHPRAGRPLSQPTLKDTSSGKSIFVEIKYGEPQAWPNGSRGRQRPKPASPALDFQAFHIHDHRPS
jgi:hypothetical protein